MMALRHCPTTGGEKAAAPIHCLLYFFLDPDRGSSLVSKELVAALLIKSGPNDISSLFLCLFFAAHRKGK